ncbi:MAG: ABC transporter permease [Actinomycetota bacterium]|nr:ABC transporter permease [Actinomycetota bacterium]
MRERSFLVATLVLLGILAAVIVLPQVLGLNETKAKAAVASRAAEALVRAAAPRSDALDVKLHVRRDGPDVAKRLVRDGDADVALVGPQPTIVVRTSLSDDVAKLLQQASAAVRADAALARAGVEPANRRAVLAPPPLPVRKLEPGGSEQTQGLAFIAVLLLFFQLIGYGYWIAAGIVEEKASRVVEILLSTLRPRVLLAGKVLGIGLLGLAQLIIVSAVGLGLALAVGALDIPGDAVGALAVVVAFFLLGFAFYAALFAMGGALVSRQEEIQNVTTPVSMLLFATYFVSFQAIDHPDGGLARILTFLPPSAPIVLPVRIIAGAVGAFEVVAGVVVIVVAAALLLAAAGRVYGNAVLKTGSRVKLADAWRASTRA